MINNIFKQDIVCKNYRIETLSKSRKFVPAIMQSGIELYPHQIEASLSAFENPFRKGFL